MIIHGHAPAPTLGVGDVVFLLVVFGLTSACAYWVAGNLDDYVLSPMATGAAGVLAYGVFVLGLIAIMVLLLKLIALMT